VADLRDLESTLHGHDRSTSLALLLRKCTAGRGHRFSAGALEGGSGQATGMSHRYNGLRSENGAGTSHLPLFTRPQIAEVLGVKPITVWNWEKETPPLPVRQPGSRGHASLYALPDVIRWWQTRELAKHVGQNGHGPSKDEAFALQATANTERIRLDIARRRGEVFDARLAIDAWSAMTQAFRSQSLALPRALAERLTHEAPQGPQAVEALLMGAMRDLLTTLSEWTPPTR
jgi:hypothetical protein